MSATTQRRWTAREVRDLIAEQPLASPRYELVDGELLVTPSPAMPHQRAVGDLFLTLANYLKLAGVGTAVTSPSDIELEPEDVRQPDIFVVATGELKRVMREGNPVRELLLAVEILSPSSGRHDRLTKRRGYQRHVPEYWIVDVDARLVERWCPADERSEIVSDVLVWHPPGAREALTLALSPLFAQVFGEDLTRA